ncbi:ADP-ribosylation factor-like protein 2 isoform X3 [Trachypithecus francoisi]|uniref:ADP-ribosylation factor-like protein 2 isoform X3 n=1 Tax=Trachypithecus francoisi TaxID=54180 RepID=UPI00141BB81D|nr:ADP-ribosylation factor-like protein 2 isoform X3 [Trachypithecus francoisi]
MPSASVIANRNRERGPGTGKKRRPGGAPGTMGLLTILKKMKQKERELRLLMLGLDNAGKTTILKKFNGEDIDTISPTLGFNIKTLEHRGFKLNIWDVGGQKSLRSYWRNYFESTDGLIWVVDSADHQRMQDCQRELQSLLVEERLAGATLLIFANKQDLPGALSSNAIREASSSQHKQSAFSMLCSLHELTHFILTTTS